MHPYIISVFSKEWYFTNSLSLLTLVFFLTFFYMIINSDYVKKNNISNKITKVLGVLILLRFIIGQIYQITYNPMLWDPAHSLPFHLCGISGILAGLILIKYNQTLYEFLLLLGIPGALWSFLTPQINIYAPGFMYFDYFISHLAILFAPLYLTILFNKRPRIKSWRHIFVKTNMIVLPIVLILNLIMYYGMGYREVNYIYLMMPPEVENPFVIGKWPFYILGLEVVGFLHIILIYSFVHNYRRLKGYIQFKKEPVV